MVASSFSTADAAAGKAEGGLPAAAAGAGAQAAALLPRQPLPGQLRKPCSTQNGGRQR